MPARVLIIGGGVAGMSAAHELIERGFDVVVLERRDIAGGKARSVPVADGGDGSCGHQLAWGAAGAVEHALPGEHGFRFFPGFYKHVIDTMRRIPTADGRTVADHLVPTTRVGVTQYDRPTFHIPAMFPRTPGDAGTILRDMLLTFGSVTDLTPQDLAHFGARIWQILTSCQERRLGEYERTGWWDFVGAEERSSAYQKFLASGITRSLVAAKARTASTRTIGDIFVQLMLTVVNPLAGSTDRVLDGPTNAVWIDPWLEYLRSRGVDYRFNSEVEGVMFDGQRVTGVATCENGARTVLAADYYIFAVPLERVVGLVNDGLVAADPRLANLRKLAPNMEWMNGIQYFLKRDVALTHGHVIHIDTEWALTSISQLQFWRSLSVEDFGDSDVRAVLSVDVSDWTVPGSNGRPAMRCSREEVVRETWNQLKRSINQGEALLRDEDFHSWFLDADIDSDPDKPDCLSNAEPLLVNLAETWQLRPEASTGIANLFLASDYVRTHTDLATMESANEAARRAVNGLLDAVDFAGPRCALWPLHEPEILAPWRLHDAARYKAGLPWDGTLMQVAAQAVQGASPLLDSVCPLLQSTAPFAMPLTDALKLHDDVMEEVGRVTGLSPAMKPGSSYVSKLHYNALEWADTALGAGDLTGPAGFLERLGWYRDLLSDTLASGIPTDEPQKHLYGLARDFIERSGKGLRPAFCIATARALGGRSEDALLAAAGIEMLHNAFLVHDDIEDGSETRRGVPAMHRQVGIPIAVNTGDAMNALAMRLFRRSGDSLGPAVALRILDEVDHMLVESLEGQAAELGWVRDNDLTLGADDYLRLVLKKTAWYSFIHPMRIGALTARGDDQGLGRFDRFGYLLGLAFQITDDVLNLNGNGARYGKEIDGDLLEGKRTLILAHTLEHADRQDRAWIANFLSRPRERRLPREVYRLHEIMARGGSIQWAQQAASEFAQAASREFDESAFAGVPAGPDLAWLRSAVDFLVSRDA
jgi:geranylgeranyl pyrophosphate synthase/uncharacterized protein with NAD-binding domain and iron-sulfur cluster